MLGEFHLATVVFSEDALSGVHGFDFVDVGESAVRSEALDQAQAIGPVDFFVDLPRRRMIQPVVAASELRGRGRGGRLDFAAVLVEQQRDGPPRTRQRHWVPVGVGVGGGSVGLSLGGEGGMERPLRGGEVPVGRGKGGEVVGSRQGREEWWEMEIALGRAFGLVRSWLGTDRPFHDDASGRMGATWGEEKEEPGLLGFETVR